MIGILKRHLSFYRDRKSQKGRATSSPFSYTVIFFISFIIFLLIIHVNHKNCIHKLWISRSYPGTHFIIVIRINTQSTLKKNITRSFLQPGTLFSYIFRNLTITHYFTINLSQHIFLFNFTLSTCTRCLTFKVSIIVNFNYIF